MTTKHPWNIPRFLLRRCSPARRRSGARSETSDARTDIVAQTFILYEEIQHVFEHVRFRTELCWLHGVQLVSLWTQRGGLPSSALAPLAPKSPT